VRAIHIIVSTKGPVGLPRSSSVLRLPLFSPVRLIFWGSSVCSVPSLSRRSFRSPRSSRQVLDRPASAKKLTKHGRTLFDRPVPSLNGSTFLRRRECFGQRPTWLRLLQKTSGREASPALPSPRLGRWSKNSTAQWALRPISLGFIFGYSDLCRILHRISDFRSSTPACFAASLSLFS